MQSATASATATASAAPRLRLQRGRFRIVNASTRTVRDFLKKSTSTCAYRGAMLSLRWEGPPRNAPSHVRRCPEGGGPGPAAASERSLGRSRKPTWCGTARDVLIKEGNQKTVPRRRLGLSSVRERTQSKTPPTVRFCSSFQLLRVVSPPGGASRRLQWASLMDDL
jgi:hypothetical protein